MNLLDELKALGVEVSPQGNNLIIRPASKVPPELKERLRAHKSEVLAILNLRPGDRIPCRYDWLPGYRGIRLHCVAHQHEKGRTTVFRMVYRGHDVLLEMAEKGLLTGQAADDASRVN